MASTATPTDATAEAQSPDTLRLLLFAVAGTVYGCDIGAVREIVPLRRTTRLPGAPSHVRGLINLRGQIVTALDLRRRLRLPEWAEQADSMNVLLPSDGAVSRVVETVEDVVVIMTEQIQSPP